MRRGVRPRTVGEARELAYDHSYARRKALGASSPSAETIQDDTVGHAYRATNLLGLGAIAAKRWAAISSRAMPKCLEALEAGDSFRLAMRDVKADARAERFDPPEELEDELRVFQRAFEARIIYRS